jgi:hypothetical protein
MSHLYQGTARNVFEQALEAQLPKMSHFPWFQAVMPQLSQTAPPGTGIGNLRKMPSGAQTAADFL